jgi:lipoprotein-releasing system permease protein
MRTGTSDKSKASAPIIQIAMGAIALGMVMMLVAMGTGRGLKMVIRDKIAAFEGHIQVIHMDQNQSQVHLKPLRVDRAQKERLASITGVSQVQEVIHKAGLIRTEDTFEGFVAKGIGQDYDTEPLRDLLVAGKLLEWGKPQNSEIVLSQTLAHKLQLKVGDQCRGFFLNQNNQGLPYQRKFEVVGIYDSGFERFDEQYIWMDIAALRKINSWSSDEVGQLELKVSHFDDLDEIAFKAYDATPSDWDVRSIKQRFSAIFEWIDLFDFNIALVVSIMLLVGGLNMVTALLVIILDRTSAIGVLKTLGATNRDIQRIFLYNAGTLVFKGMFWGNLLGLIFLASQYYGKWIKFPNPQDYYINYVPVALDLFSWLLLNGVVLTGSVLMLLLPARVVASIHPARTVKFK